MSKTIKTNKKLKEPFFTNINYEHLIGRICDLAGAKCYTHDYGDIIFYDMAYEMSKAEAIDAIEKIKAHDYSNDWDTLKRYYAKECDSKDLLITVDEFVTFLKESQGYKCI